MFRPDISEIIFDYNINKSQWLVGMTATVFLLPDLKIRNERARIGYKFWSRLEIFKVYF